MTREELLKAMDGVDDGQEICEPVARAIPGLTLHDLIYLKSLVELDLKRNPPD